MFSKYTLNIIEVYSEKSSRLLFNEELFPMPSTFQNYEMIAMCTSAMNNIFGCDI